MLIGELAPFAGISFSLDFGSYSFYFKLFCNLAGISATQSFKIPLVEVVTRLSEDTSIASGFSALAEPALRWRFWQFMEFPAHID